MLILVGAGIIVFEATRRLVIGSEVETLGVGIAVIGVSVVANLVVSGYLYRRARGARLAGARGRRRPPAHRRADLGRRARRAGASSRSPAAASFDSIAALVVAGAIVVAGRPDHPPLRPGAGRRGAAGRRSWTGSRRRSPPPGRPEMVGYHKLRARRAGRRGATSTSTSSSAPARASRTRTGLAHDLRDAIEAELRNCRRADPRRARGVLPRPGEATPGRRPSRLERLRSG